MNAQHRSCRCTRKDVSTRVTRVTRWIARMLGVAVIGFLLCFAVGEGLNPLRLPLREWVLFLFFPLGISLGMIVAWRCVCLGGSLTVANLAAFYLVHRLLSRHWPQGVASAVFALPGFLFPLCCLGDCWSKKPAGAQHGTADGEHT